MASKFSEFVASKKIDTRRLLVASAKLEKLSAEDRAERARMAKKGAEKKSEGEAKKPHSGRPVTQVLLDRAEAGKPVPGAAKTRVLRAVNHVLEQKKQAAVSLKDLF